MQPVYTYDHIHLRTRDPKAVIDFYVKMFDAKAVEFVQSDGKPRVNIDHNGFTIFVAEVAETGPEHQSGFTVSELAMGVVNR